MKHVKEKFGFSVGQMIRTVVPTSGSDENDQERSFPAGSEGQVYGIEDLGEPQGWAFTVTIEGEITNVFDEKDGPIHEFIEPLPISQPGL